MLEAPMKTKEERDKKINTFITSLSKMTIVDYLQHMKKGEKKVEEIERKKSREDSDDDSTIDEAINKILKLKDIEKRNEDIDFGIAWVYERGKKKEIKEQLENK